MRRVSLFVLGLGLVLGDATGLTAQSVSTGPFQSAAAVERGELRTLRDGPGTVETAPVPPVPVAGVTPGRPRPCDGCPPRRPGYALLETTGINVMYGMANLIRGQNTARITPGSWLANIKSGWVWDSDAFVVNQIGHPYQGSNYFNAGRANGLGFYESAGLAAFGSGTWEYFGETNRPSLNDFLNTTLGGAALGEMIHRTGWLIRNTQMTGRGRLWREIAAAAVDPATGLSRFVTGDASRVSEKPSQFVPSTPGGTVSAGVLRRGSNREPDDQGIQPFVQIDLSYGDTESGRSRTPYDAFGVRLTAGGGGAITEARVKGRLLGQPFHRGRLQFSILQSYTFLGNGAYHVGAQSIETRVGGTAGRASRVSLALVGWGGVTLLGAVDSRPLSQPATPSAAAEPGGRRPAEGSRHYDYGPGSTFGASVALNHGGRPLIAAQYEGRTLYSLDGVRANHVLQRGRAEVIAPAGSRLGIGVTGEYFARHSFYQDQARTRRTYRYPQFRVFLAWNMP